MKLITGSPLLLICVTEIIGKLNQAQTDINSKNFPNNFIQEESWERKLLSNGDDYSSTFSNQKAIAGYDVSSDQN